ncbi:MAG: macro domain-containing protein [Candidatus Hadarchaeales archaeon]
MSGVKKCRIGVFAVETTTGDITGMKADAICNPANSLMYMGGGAAGALKRAGGEVIEKEALRHAPVPVGRAIATTAGRLTARWVIHAPTMERPAMPTTQEKVRMAVLAALRCADEVGAESIVFPGMGTGVGGLSFASAAEAMISAVRGFRPKALKKIILCDRNEGMVSAWLEKLK